MNGTKKWNNRDFVLIVDSISGNGFRKDGRKRRKQFENKLTYVLNGTTALEELLPPSNEAFSILNWRTNYVQK